MKRPTEQDLYEDAKQILDKLLKKQLDDKLKARGKPRRSVTDPFPNVRRPITAKEVLDERAEHGLDDGINRSQTMPTRPRPSRDAKLKQSDLDSLNKLIKQEGSSPGASAASSEASDGESSLVSENREKKSLFRRAKDRLRHAFHRQEREHKMKGKVGEKDGHKTDKLKKKSPKVHKVNKNKLSDSQTGSPKSIGDSRSDKQSPIKDKQNSSTKDSRDKREHSVNSEDGKRRHTMDSRGDHRLALGEINGSHRNSVGRSFFNSIRKSFSGGKRNRPTISAGFEGSNSGHGSSDKSLPPSSDKSTTPSPVSGAPYMNGESHNLLEPPMAYPHDKSPSPHPHSSSTNSHYGNRSISINSHLSAGSKNVLDDPGEDIEYMDEADSGRSEPVMSALSSKVIAVDNGHHKSQVNYGKVHPRLLPQSSLAEDGESDSHDGKDKPEGMDSFLMDNVPLHERTCEEKEEMYGVIAQKLMKIGDSCVAKSGVSDSERSRDRGTQAASHLQVDGDSDSLADLGRQIVECLRQGGDRANSIIAPLADKEVEQVKTEVYERFKQTVQHSLGNEVSWNHLALLFYTTKVVVSAVGRGSQAASTAKEMSLRYVTDMCATFIMDQGGFDSVLSESDSDLD